MSPGSDERERRLYSDRNIVHVLDEQWFLIETNRVRLELI